MTTFIIILIVLAVLAVVTFLYSKAAQTIKLHREQKLRLWCITYLSNNTEEIDGIEYYFNILNQLPSDQLSICKKIAPGMISSYNYRIEDVVIFAQYVLRGTIFVPPQSKKEVPKTQLEQQLDSMNLLP